MISSFFRQLVASIGIVFRTIRAFFGRQITSLTARFRSATSVTRQASKLAPAMLKTAAQAGKKPTRREDYIETDRLFISKSFLILAVVSLVLLMAFVWMVGWPWMQSRFFTTRLWVEDVDAATHTGKVILYHDETKEQPLFEGRLEAGVRQGEGRLFDPSGRMTYEGTFAEDLFSGEGSLYEEGVLRYAGSFAEGLYEGEGMLYAPDGTVIYKGGFLRGERSGEGVAYREDGVIAYRGAFAEDRYSGRGVACDETGETLYRGDFVDGLYEGEGVLTLDADRLLRGVFEKGRVTGEASLELDGRVYYQGAVSGTHPAGLGVLYDRAGAEVYAGRMSLGAVDGAALLGLSAADARALFPAVPAERSFARGFLVGEQAAGLALFCSYAAQDSASTVYQVCLWRAEDEGLAQLLWEDAAAFEDVAREQGLTLEKREGGQMALDLPFALSEAAGFLPDALSEKSLYCQPYQGEGFLLRLWSEVEGGPLLMAQWSGEGALPEVPDLSSGGAASSEGRLSELLEKLGLAVSQAAGEAQEDALPAAANPHYGGEPPEALVALAEAPRRGALVEAMLTYLQYAEQLSAAEESLVLYEAMLAEEQEKQRTGQGDEDRLAQLTEQSARKQVEISKYRVQMTRAEKTVQGIVGATPADYDLQLLPLLFDVGELDVEALGQAIVQTATAEAEAEARARAIEETARLREEARLAAEEAIKAREEAARREAEEAALPEAQERAGQQPADVVVETPEVEFDPSTIVVEPELVEIDRAALLQDMEFRVLELEIAWQEVLLSRDSYESALRRARAAAEEFARGTTAKAVCDEAQIVANDRRGALYGTLVSFSKQALALDLLSGGLLSEQFDWVLKGEPQQDALPVSAMS